jgi:hypothetical protein
MVPQIASRYDAKCADNRERARLRARSVHVRSRTS